MANFTAADVKKLREFTGAGMMDCKKALDEADGDFDQAVEILRVKGAAKAAKRGAEREASAGLVAHAPGILVELKCETDFVAKGEDFVATAQRIADAGSEAQAADVEALKAVSARGPDGRRGRRVAGDLDRREDRARPGRLLRRAGRGVHAQARGRPAARRRRARRVRRQRRGRPRPPRCRSRRCARSTSPVTRSPPTSSPTSGTIAEKTSREEGKPEQAIAKITEGRLNGFFKDVVLLEQPSVVENKKSVKAVLDAAGTTLKRFARFEVGA